MVSQFFTKFTNIGLVLFSIVVALVVTDMVLAPKLLGLSRDTVLLGFSAMPGQVVDGVQINASGFAGDLIENPKPEDTLRIITLGGSSLFDNNITVRLKQRLAQDIRRRVEVASGALQGHTSTASLIKYQRYFKKFPADYVLIYDGMNDLFANHVAPQDFRDDYSHMGPEYQQGFILERCMTCRLLWNRYLGPRFVKRVYRGSGFASEHVFEKNLRALVRDIRENGAQPVLMTYAIAIPDDYSEHKFYAKEAGYSRFVKGEGFHPVELWGDPDYVREGIARHNRVIRTIAAEYRLGLIDQEKNLGGNLEYFGDVCHFSEPGIEAFIEHVSVYLAEQEDPSAR